MTDKQFITDLKTTRLYRLSTPMLTSRKGVTPEAAVRAIIEQARDAVKGRGDVDFVRGLLVGASLSLEPFPDDIMVNPLRRALILAGDYLDFRQVEQFEVALYRDNTIRLDLQRAGYKIGHGEDHPVSFVSKPFELGKTYRTWEGQEVKIVEVKNDAGYECVRGDDASEDAPNGVWRYNREGLVERGRVTGSPANTPRNLIPEPLYA